jgi:hypothetical protein
MACVAVAQTANQIGAAVPERRTFRIWPFNARTKIQSTPQDHGGLRVEREAEAVIGLAL